MSHYTGEKLLSIDDLKRLRDLYNTSGDFTDMGFMHELFHGLDGIIDNLEQAMFDCQKLENERDRLLRELSMGDVEVMGEKGQEG